MASLYAVATDTDRIGKEGYTVTVEDGRIVVNGSFAWGLLDKVTSALNENGDIKTIVLDGPGGHVGVGTRLGRMIKARGLDTLTTEMCASACSLAFAAGNRRLLRKGARLGFHAVSGESAGAIAAGTRDAMAYWRELGVSEDFIAHIYATPAEEVWWPANDELQRGNVVTAIVR